MIKFSQIGKIEPMRLSPTTTADEQFAYRKEILKWWMTMFQLLCCTTILLAGCADAESVKPDSKSDVDEPHPLAAVCKGRGVPSTAEYVRTSPGPHPIVLIMKSEGLLHGFDGQKPKRWGSKSIERIELVAVISQSSELIQFMPGPSHAGSTVRGGPLTARQHMAKIDVREALTGRLVSQMTVYGRRPGTRRKLTVDSRSRKEWEIHSVDGRHVSFEDIKPYLSQLVMGLEVGWIPNVDQGDVSSLALANDGNIAIVTERSTLSFWNVETATQLWSVDSKSSSINAVQIAPNGKTVLAIHENTIRARSMENGSIEHEIPAPDGCRFIAWTPKTETVMAVGEKNGRVLCIVRVSDGQVIAQTSTFGPSCDPIGVSDNSQYVMLGCSDREPDKFGSIQVWDTHNDKVHTLYRWKKTASRGSVNARFMPNNREILVSDSKDKMHFCRIDIATRKVAMPEMSLFGRLPGGVISDELMFSRNGQYAILRTHGGVVLHDIGTRTKGKEFVDGGRHQLGWESVALSHDGRLLLSYGKSGARLFAMPGTESGDQIGTRVEIVESNSVIDQMEDDLATLYGELVGVVDIRSTIIPNVKNYAKKSAWKQVKQQMVELEDLRGTDYFEGRLTAIRDGAIKTAQLNRTTETSIERRYDDARKVIRRYLDHDKFQEFKEEIAELQSLDDMVDDK